MRSFYHYATEHKREWGLPNLRLKGDVEIISWELQELDYFQEGLLCRFKSSDKRVFIPWHQLENLKWLGGPR